MTFQIQPLRDTHLEDAAVLVTDRYRAEREHVPSLPPRYEDVSAILPLLRDLAGQAPGVAALRDGRLVGFLLGMVLPVFRGRRSIYCPEWANAAEEEHGPEIYQEMYTRLAARWVTNGIFTHLVTVFAHQAELIGTFHWLGFGFIAVDAIRDLTPLQGAVANVEISRAGPEETQQAKALSEALQRYLAAAPTFLAFTEKYDWTYHEEWLTNPANALWLAFRGEEAVACLALEPSNPKAAYVIDDEKTVSITRAFTKEHLRGDGIGKALLQEALEWARSAGYERCAVDFEPENVTGARFWMKHFQPVCYSLVRNVDERVAWANERRDQNDLW